MSIGDGCQFQGIILHEVFHALGRWHEHSRPDRDSYITVNYRNIRDGTYYRDGGMKLHGAYLWHILDCILYIISSAKLYRVKVAPTTHTRAHTHCDFLA